jgi:hypothetical protein
MSRPISLSLFTLDVVDLLDGARALADAVARKQLDEEDESRSAVMIAGIVSAAAERLRMLARTATGAVDPIWLASPRVMAFEPIDRNDLDIRISWTDAQRARHLRRLLARVEGDRRASKPKSKRKAR